MEKKWLKRVVLGSLLVWIGLFFCQKIDLTTVDLGRHIKNGEMILSHQWGVLYTNFYSYTEPDFPVINHHWGSGAVFYLVQKLAGFEGLTIVNIALNLAIFYLIFDVARREAGMKIATIVSMLLVPLIVARREVRPEVFSYLGIAGYFYLLWLNRRGELKRNWLWLLPISQILWVNMHIYFMFGPALVGLFWLEEMVRERKLKTHLSLILPMTMAACLVSPFGLKGVIYPFEILRNYGYQIVENKSVGFLTNYGFKDVNLGWYKLTIGLMIFSFIVLVLRNRQRFSLIYFVLFLVWGGLGYYAIRNFSMFGGFALIILSYNLRNAKLGIERIGGEVVTLAALTIFMISVGISYQKLPWSKEGLGLGLAKNNNASAEFYRKLGIKGAIFNNYDVGSYLIYHLFPDEQVFVDNRPEAFSVTFFQEDYIPMQTEAEIWEKMLQKYNFQTIFFSHRDITPWGQQFLVTRVKDPEWAVIYYDHYNIIMVRRDEQNEEIINEHEISKEYFGTTPT